MRDSLFTRSSLLSPLPSLSLSLPMHLLKNYKISTKQQRIINSSNANLGMSHPKKKRSIPTSHGKWFIFCFYTKETNKFDANWFPWLTKSADWKRCTEKRRQFGEVDVFMCGACISRVSQKNLSNTKLTNSPLHRCVEHQRYQNHCCSIDLWGKGKES